ncbi:MAG: hypothetical protein JO100_08050 [Pseudonocardia sp.]|nr:hypothetical protein [Pseudonocardia sp.]
MLRDLGQGSLWHHSSGCLKWFGVAQRSTEHESAFEASNEPDHEAAACFFGQPEACFFGQPESSAGLSTAAGDQQHSTVV